MGVTRAEKRTRNRRDFAQKRLSAARQDDARLAAAYGWFLAELAAYEGGGGDASKLTARLAKTMREAAEQLAEANRHGR